MVTALKRFRPSTVAFATRELFLVTYVLRKGPNCDVVNEIRSDYGKNAAYYTTDKAAYSPLHEALIIVVPRHMAIITRVRRTRQGLQYR
jgi:hypothetical protein